MSYEVIIQRVKNTPEMWAVDHKHYKNKKIIKKFWTDLAQELRCTEDHAKKRWKHLKDQFRKELKKLITQNNGQMPPDDQLQSVWQWFDHLRFMKTEIIHKDAQKKKEDSSTEEEDQPLRKRRKAEFEISRLEDEHHANVDLGAMDPDYMFLMSLLPTMKSLTDIQKLQLRGKINEWLLQALTQSHEESFDTKYHLTQHLTNSIQ